MKCAVCQCENTPLEIHEETVHSNGNHRSVESGCLYAILAARAADAERIAALKGERDNAYAAGYDNGTLQRKVNHDSAHAVIAKIDAALAPASLALERFKVAHLEAMMDGTEGSVRYHLHAELIVARAQLASLEKKA